MTAESFRTACRPPQADATCDASVERVREVCSVGGIDQRTTYYLHSPGGTGLLYEEETTSTGWKKRFYINAGNKTVATLQYTSSGANGEFQYWHTDRLGSTEAVTSATGTVVERLAYEPFGKRRNANGTSDANGTLAATSTDRGYTGHEMMDEVGLVNMNGRIYDPALGRFLSADPFVQNPSDTQSYNRYSYVFNNPTGMVDPSGYFGFDDPYVSIYGGTDFTRGPGGGRGGGGLTFDTPIGTVTFDIGGSGGSGGGGRANTPSTPVATPVEAPPPAVVPPPAPVVVAPPPVQTPQPGTTPVVNPGPSYTAAQIADHPKPWSGAGFQAAERYAELNDGMFETSLDQSTTRGFVT